MRLLLAKWIRTGRGRVLSAIVVALMIFGAGLFGLTAGIRTQEVLAQGGGGEECPYNSCDFYCTSYAHDWYMEDDGIWIIVEATPYNDTAGGNAQWYDTSTPSYPPLEVTGVWSDGAITVTSSVTVSDNGICSYEDGAGTYIWCHDFKVGANPSTLCDSYSGNWDRVGASASCLSRLTTVSISRKKSRSRSARCVGSMLLSLARSQVGGRSRRSDSQS